MLPLTEIFCFIDDFCKQFESANASMLLEDENKQRDRPFQMYHSEIMTILVCFHLSHYRTFKDFYICCVQQQYKGAFPKLVSYTRFVEIQKLAIMPLVLLLMSCTGALTGKYYIDSSKLEVCHNLRIWGHKVFKGLAKRGKSSTGWFFGFKIHLVVNNHGELVAFCFTTGDKDDRRVVEKLTANLRGWLFGDKGYLSQKLEESLFARGLRLITKVRRNMKERKLNSAERYLLSKRGMIESVIDQLKAICHVQHTRHRSIFNYMANLLGGLMAYVFKPKKPSVGFGELNNIKLLA